MTNRRADACAEGLTDLFVSVREIRHVSAYPEWAAPHQRRAQQERAAQDLAALRTRLLLEFHDDEAIGAIEGGADDSPSRGRVQSGTQRG